MSELNDPVNADSLDFLFPFFVSALPGWSNDQELA